jgi:hypothetical protein
MPQIPEFIGDTPVIVIFPTQRQALLKEATYLPIVAFRKGDFPRVSAKMDILNLSSVGRVRPSASSISARAEA